MALITCPECGKKVSDTSDHCIHCGYKIVGTENIQQLSEIKSNEINEKKQTNKKRFLIIIIIAAIIAVLIAIPVGYNASVTRARQDLIDSTQRLNDITNELNALESLLD